MTVDSHHRRSLIRATCLAAAAICALLSVVIVRADDTSAAGRLAEYHLEPTAASLSGYLQSLEPTPERQKRLRELIRELDDADFARRAQATGELMQQVGGVAPLLDEAIRGDNPEIRWRAKVIRDQIDRDSRAVLSTVLSAIQERKITGLAMPLFVALPLCGDQHLRQQF